jgi:hypothetical protein
MRVISITIAIQNLTKEEIDYLKLKGDKDDFSFFGIR